MARLRTVLRRALGWPARRVLDRRVQWILAALDERIGPSPPRPGLHHRLDLLQSELEHVDAALGESLLGRRLATLSTAQEVVLPGDTARFLNWAEGGGGPAARSNLWFNPPVPVRYDEGGAEVLLVNERIVEQPYVFAALSVLPRGSRVLDVGGAESTVALSLASLGHEVHVVDPRGYRLRHAQLHSHALRLDELASGHRFDAAVALSCIEHFGLGAYGSPGGASGATRLDRQALADIHERLDPGGLLVLTVPCGADSTEDEFQRRYSLAELREMLAGWELVDLSVVWRRAHRSWVRADPGDPPGEVGVALVSARRPASG